MKSFSEFSFGQQLGIMLVAAIAIVGFGEFVYFYPAESLNDQRKANQALEERVRKQEKDNDDLRPLKDELNTLRADNIRLGEQLETLRNIVPEEKEADTFIRMLRAEAEQAGVNVRSFIAKADIQQEYYIEVPFDLTLDGTYFTVLDFFSRLGGLTRTINVSNLRMRPIGKGGGGKYTITPNETIAATCTATTFYSREAPPAASQ